VSRQGVQSALALVVIAAVLGVWIWIEQRPVERVSPPAGQAIVIDKSPRAQGERKAVIDWLVEQGHVRRIDEERAGPVRVSLRPSFYEMDEATRRKYLHVVYGYYFDGSSMTDTVMLRDARHGNNVGRYDPYSGLTMYK
jgi:hypothetical protein